MARRLLAGEIADGDSVTFDVSPEHDGLVIA